MSLLTMRNELKARGFSRFLDAELDQYLNWSRNRIARKGLWNWEKKTQAFSLTAGANPVFDLSTIADFESVEKVTITTANYRKTLKPMTRSTFESEWFPLDLTLSKYRSEPSAYAVWGNSLYIVPPPLSTRGGNIYYHARLAAMVGDAAVSGMDSDSEELIIMGALIYCHERAQEWDAAAVYKNQMEEYYSDLRAREGMRAEEQPDRVLADDTWL